MDITNAIMDQELGRSAFTVERLTYTRTVRHIRRWAAFIREPRR